MNPGGVFGFGEGEGIRHISTPPPFCFLCFMAWLRMQTSFDNLSLCMFLFVFVERPLASTTHLCRCPNLPSSSRPWAVDLSVRVAFRYIDFDVRDNLLRCGVFLMRLCFTDYQVFMVRGGAKGVAHNDASRNSVA